MDVNDKQSLRDDLEGEAGFLDSKTEAIRDVDTASAFLVFTVRDSLDLPGAKVSTVTFGKDDSVSPEDFVHFCMNAEATFNERIKPLAAEEYLKQDEAKTGNTFRELGDLIGKAIIEVFGPCNNLNCNNPACQAARKAQGRDTSPLSDERRAHAENN